MCYSEVFFTQYLLFHIITVVVVVVCAVFGVEVACSRSVSAADVELEIFIDLSLFSTTNTSALLIRRTKTCLTGTTSCLSLSVCLSVCLSLSLCVSVCLFVDIYSFPETP